ncbi:DUF1707 and DUF4870 domain-containing protein [Micropruina sonneratiae]|uniref:DUF1707 and DUF4870 domain-containing protein n=1 Tax=Micropruina sonneratiae TaxID=2986940 RepID=UPI002227A416|nr:DUF1707 and DUF4870 domain-containing protein [Micropruina sp. KQZ13P-5]MCW3157420.1 DUF1707 and DUF4870 domain-containing protein [Micropruina sp. KQZ13P-5]
MTNDFFAPVDHVSAADRLQAEQKLRDAHQRGLLGADEFEARMSAVIMAERLPELTAAVEGQAPMPPAGSWQGYRTPSEPVNAALVAPASRSARGSTTMAVAAHLSPLLTWLLGPLVIWAVSPVGSPARREAAKAFNWQLVASAIGLAASMIGWILPGDANPVARIWMVIWLVLTVIGAVAAAKGRDWSNPVRRLVGWEVLSERGR